MRIVTMKDIDNFQTLLGELGRRSAEGKRIALGTNEVVQYNAAIGNEGAALQLGVTAAQGLMNELDDISARFVESALHCFGEKPTPGEKPMDFMSRLSRWSAEKLMAAQRRNGIHLLP